MYWRETIEEVDSDETDEDYDSDSDPYNDSDGEREGEGFIPSVIWIGVWSREVR